MMRWCTESNPKFSDGGAWMTPVIARDVRSTSAKPFQTLRMARWFALSMATPVT